MPEFRHRSYQTVTEEELERIFAEFFLVCDERRKEMGISQSEWGKRAKISTHSIYHYMAGGKRERFPRFPQIIQLARALGLKVSLVLERAEERPTGGS
jgi:hypothetical protein